MGTGRSSRHERRRTLILNALSRMTVLLWRVSIGKKRKAGKEDGVGADVGMRTAAETPREEAGQDKGW